MINHKLMVYLLTKIMYLKLFGICLVCVFVQSQEYTISLSNEYAPGVRYTCTQRNVGTPVGSPPHSQLKGTLKKNQLSVLYRFKEPAASQVEGVLCEFWKLDTAPNSKYARLIVWGNKFGTFDDPPGKVAKAFIRIVADGVYRNLGKKFPWSGSR